MQNRIETLWKQTTHTCVPREGDYVSVSSKNIQEFAELIIKECIKIANRAVCDEREVRCIDDVINEHFGIKE